MLQPACREGREAMTIFIHGSAAHLVRDRLGRMTKGVFEALSLVLGTGVRGVAVRLTLAR